MRNGFCREVRYLPTAADYDVVFSTLPRCHHLMRQVGKLHQFSLHLRGNLLKGICKLLLLLLHGSNTAASRFSLRLPALLHHGAYLPGEAVELCLY